MAARAPDGGKIRYAVVGLGHIAQTAVLPAFAHARENSVLAALVSDDYEKLETLGKKYGVATNYSYAQYDDCLRSGNVDAVYIALPNHLHRDYAVRAAEAGVHVLCEKPMAPSEQDCADMIRAAEQNAAKLMVAYRLHFEETNLKAVELARSGQLGELRVFASLFTMSIADPNNIRLLPISMGGGTVYDVGIYCINAARYLFRAEPYEVFAWSARRPDPRFHSADEMTSAILRFPDDRLASFTTSFGAADVSQYRLIGTRGDVRVEPAYEYAAELEQWVTIEGQTRHHTFARRDQFAPELLYFSNCVLHDRTPEPSGWEGLADVRVIRAVYESAETGRPVRLEPFSRPARPSLDQEIHRPPVAMPETTGVRPPSG